jgi:succinoglycan biosynthesis transport protein ExoP
VDLKQYLRVLRNRRGLIVACLLLSVLTAGGYAFTQQPMYAATTQLFVSTSGDQAGNAQAAYQGGLFGQQRVKSYAAIVSSEPVVQRVKDELHLPESVTHLRAEISASAPLDTVLVDVTVSDPSPGRARAIADSLGRQFANRINELETPQGQKTSPVKVSVAQPPTLPTSPVSPKKKLDLALGILIGLAVGAGGAVLRETLDTRVRDQDSVTDLVGAPVLGGFLENESARVRPLMADEDNFSPRAEAFRQLRTNIRFLSVDQTLRSLVVTSSVAAEGKSTVASNLAIALAQSGEQVVLVDADLRRPVVGEMMGLNPQVGLTNVLLETTHLDAALQEYRPGLSLQVLASGPIPPNPSELLGSQRMRDVLMALQDRSTIVIFDSPPLLPVTDAAVLAAHTDGAILIVRAGHTHRDQVRNSIASLRQVGAQLSGVVMNRLPARRPGAGYGYGYNTYYGPREPITAISAKDLAGASAAELSEARGSSEQE